MFSDDLATIADHKRASFAVAHVTKMSWLQLYANN